MASFHALTSGRNSVHFGRVCLFSPWSTLLAQQHQVHMSPVLMHQMWQHVQAASATSQPAQARARQNCLRLQVLCMPLCCKRLRPLTLQPAAQTLRLAAATSLLHHAVRRERPRLRRRAITRRPPLVRRRCKKPCRFLRTRLLGWYVRLTMCMAVGSAMSVP